MITENDMAYPFQDNGSTIVPQPGLTKLEYFSAMAMQGDAASIESNNLWDDKSLEIRAKEWVKMAQALIKELNKKEQV